jgi:hypothetical protein
MTFVITPAIDGTFTVHATHYERDLSVKSCLWRTLSAAQAEAKRIELSWKYGTGTAMGRGGSS